VLNISENDGSKDSFTAPSKRDRKVTFSTESLRNYFLYLFKFIVMKTNVDQPQPEACARGGDLQELHRRDLAGYLQTKQDFT
jgi:hypothetical protein